jgi:transcriptional regulator GlxA family with amidase domain
LLYRVLQGPQGWMLRDIAAPGTALSRIGVTIRWIRENFATPLRVEALASMAALSVSAFHRHFKAVTALSPLQYQKRVRLLHARNMLIAGEGNTTSVAFGVGYESPTQFSREYSRFFGPAPVERHAPDRAGDPTGDSLDILVTTARRLWQLSPGPDVDQSGCE